MGNSVLIPYDGSEQADRAVAHAIERFADSKLVMLTVINPAESVYATGEGAVSPFPENWYESAEEQAKEMVARAIEQAEEAGVDASSDVVVGRPGRAIVDYAQEHDMDHIVMGSHGRSGVSRILLGSVAETVIRRSPVPVTVIR